MAAKPTVSNRITASDLLAQCNMQSTATVEGASIFTKMSANVVGSFKAGQKHFGPLCKIAEQDAADRNNNALVIEAHLVAKRINERRAALEAFLATQ